MAANRVDIFPAMPPPLVAGRYEVRLDQEMGVPAEADPLGDVAGEVRHVEITAPRVAMPGTELFSTYPPPNATGPFTTRLPQVALRRRTLPWERAMPPPAAPATVNPWLALVVVTVEEATFLSGVAAPDAFTPGVAARLGVVDDGTRADAIEVTRTGVRDLFPRKDELHLLAHVRRVDVADTELAGNDDDGVVAVLLSGRLPQPGIAYRACVVSLEGQFDVLADPAPAVDERPGRPTLYADLPVAQIEAALYPVTGNPVPLTTTGQPSKAPAGTLGRPVRADAWTQAAAGPSVADPAPGGALARFGGAFVRPGMDLAVLEPGVARLRFPVLASWEFTCEGRGDFASLMHDLDVGLLGTVPAPPPEAPPPEAPPQAAPPTVLETGHLEIAHHRRRGDAGRAWFRGPLTPREVARRPATVPFLTADQARRIGSDGREDLSEAAAFEIGRLLALSAPRFVAALRAWARDGFTVRRTRLRLDGLGLQAIPGVAGVPVRTGVGLLATLAVEGGTRLGPQVPVVDLGPLADVTPDPERLATGLGLDPGFVRDVLADHPTTASLSAVATAPLPADPGALLADPGALRHLGAALHVEVDRLQAGSREEGPA